ncbi:carbohydrate ABC transporter permease [Galbitalea soli]|uniref:Carbohydrate ABC transporter permease n=1 Tax=Galbitalea soli TaxID=1268042 RepID=A0A7C9TU43_9MICO|nr:carbohydrate ABC transporter permease [Galbitalea soli]NEM92482.1 carbohydrate ABC transporter permease [Galbitalea soli]NYJ29517.1 multiple sugar transport system permease protein [Galbitalea soli]
MTALAPRLRARPRAAAGAATTFRYVVLIAGAIVMVTPFAYMVATSFQGQAYVLTLPPQFIPSHPTTANYTTALGAQNFALYFLNSAIVTIISTALSVLLSSMMAFAFARFRFRGREVIFRILLAGLTIPAVMLLIPQYILARDLHLLDSLTGLIFFYVAGSLSLNTFLLRGFLASVPAELDQAMQVDGATAWTRYWRLALPLAKPAIATATIFTFLNGWDEYPIALTLINNPDHSTLPLAIANYQGQNATQWGLVFAASLIAVIPVIIVFLVFQRYFVQGLTAGAVKG